MKPSEARALLLAQHEQLRNLFAEAAVLGERLCRGEPAIVEFHAAVARLREAFQIHNDSEALLLEPLLRPADDWGPMRVARLTQEHTQEHEALRTMLIGDDFEVARRFPDFVEELLAHMEAEERTVLSPLVLRDETEFR